jgi:hypothetical protein
LGLRKGPVLRPLKSGNTYLTSTCSQASSNPTAFCIHFGGSSGSRGCLKRASRLAKSSAVLILHAIHLYRLRDSVALFVDCFCVWTESFESVHASPLQVSSRDLSVSSHRILDLAYHTNDGHLIAPRIELLNTAVYVLFNFITPQKAACASRTTQPRNQTGDYSQPGERCLPTLSVYLRSSSG